MRYSKLATELGLSKGQNGVEATVALRRGQWDEARRLLLAQEEHAARAEAARSASSSTRWPTLPSVQRWWRSCSRLDPKVATQEELLMPYLQLGQYDLAYSDHEPEP